MTAEGPYAAHLKDATENATRKRRVSYMIPKHPYVRCLCCPMVQCPSLSSVQVWCWFCVVRCPFGLVRSPIFWYGAAIFTPRAALTLGACGTSGSVVASAFGPRAAIKFGTQRSVFS